MFLKKINSLSEICLYVCYFKVCILKIFNTLEPNIPVDPKIRTFSSIFNFPWILNSLQGIYNRLLNFALM